MKEENRKKFKVLLAEDNQIIRTFFLRKLVQQGLQVVAVQDGAEAMAEFDKEKFDLIVSDMRMPGIDGFALFEHVRASNAHVPFILMSGLVTAELQARVASLGRALIGDKINETEIFALISKEIEKLSER